MLIWDYVGLGLLALLGAGAAGWLFTQLSELFDWVE